MKGVVKYLRGVLPGFVGGIIAALFILFFSIAGTWPERYSLGVQAYATVILAAVTALLSFVAYLNLRETKEIVGETRAQRQSAFLPILVAHCWPNDSYSKVTVVLENVGPGPALDIGVTIVDGQPAEVERAWKDGKTSGIGSVRCGFYRSEVASKAGTFGDPKDIELPVHPGTIFLVVIECNDVYGNIIGSYRQFCVLEVEQGRRQIRVTKTVSTQKVNYRIENYPGIRTTPN